MNSTNSGIEGIYAYVAGQPQKVTGAVVARAVALASPVNLVTAGAGTITAALLAPGTTIVRTGPGAAFNDTFDTTANILAAYPEFEIGQSWTVDYVNTVAFAATFVAGDANTTLTGKTNAGTYTRSKLVFTKTAATTLAIMSA